MAEYDRLALLASEEQELRSLKTYAPFRDWHAVKALVHEARFFDTKRKAMAFAKKHSEARVYRAVFDDQGGTK